MRLILSTGHRRRPLPSGGRQRTFGRAVVACVLLAGALYAVNIGRVGADAATIPAPDAAPDEARARTLAMASGSDVEILDQTTETRRAWALPNGSVRLQLHAAPERVKDASGAWQPVDLRLQHRSDGTVGPAVDAYGIVLAGSRTAGTSPTLVAANAGTQRISLGWRGTLPEPVLEGSKATYVNVKPGVDLVVELSGTGFEYFVVLRNRQAANSLPSVSMPVRMGNLAPVQAEPGGAIEFRTPDGKAAVSLPPAEMWDGSIAPSTGERLRRAPVAMATTANGDGGMDLKLTPAAGFFDQPGLQWPVTIDPVVTLSPAFDAFVQNGFTSDQSGSAELKLGYVVDAAAGCASACRARSFLSFHSLDGYDGSTVVSAELFLWNWHSWSCRATSWEAWRTSYVNSTVRWTNQPDWVERDGTSTGTKGYSGDCNDGWISVSVKKTFQHSFNSTGHSANIGLRATNESSNLGWKRLNSANASSNRPYVSLNFNRTPNTPNTMSISDCATQCASPAVVSRLDPELGVKASDPDGGTLTVRFEVYDGVSATPVRTGAKTGYPSGSATPAKWRITPALSTNGWYKWRARACDTLLCSSWTGYFEFTTDTTAPPPPDVAPVDPARYFEDVGSGETSGGIGVPGQLRLSGTADVHHFKWQLDGGPFSPDVPATGTSPRTAEIAVVPLMDLVRVLVVEAYDAAGRKASTTYRFSVSSPETETARFWLDGNADNELSDNDGIAPGVTWPPGHAGVGQSAYTYGSGGISSQYPILATAPNPSLSPQVPRSFSVAAWVRMYVVAGNRTAVAQAGTTKAMFELGFQAVENNFCFSIFNADVTNSPAHRACATAPVGVGQWFHLAGVFDAVNRKVYLYVNGGSNLPGGQTVVVDFTATPFSATGKFLIGYGWNGAAPGAPFDGEIDDVFAFQRAIPEEEVQVLALS
jgi:hypothetical protein